jgi:hypothetical protein
MVTEFLSEKGIRTREWNKDKTLLDVLATCNRSYLRNVESELINGNGIVREEATHAIDALTEDSRQRVAIVGAAGMGKSCTLAQIIGHLDQRNIPFLTLRMDLLVSAQTAEPFGRALGFPTSPAVTLAGIANGGASVLIIDQLDALSYASGRNQHLWTVFEDLLDEATRFPRMRVLLACRSFDAEHDHRIRRFLSYENACKRIDLKQLSLREVEAAVEKAGIDFQGLSQHDLLLLRTPQNLSLFLQGGPVSPGRIGSVQNLLDRYWTHKRRQVGLRLGGNGRSRWTEVVAVLTEWLSNHQTLSAPSDVIDEFEEEAMAMASEHVLVMESGVVRFFHESVFDYAFARTHVSRGGSAKSLLLESETEQHLFRRAQIRQILAYERDRNDSGYLIDLKEVLSGAGVRSHLKKLVIDWLGDLPDPWREEWGLIQSLANVPPLSLWWKIAPHGSVAWFDLLLSSGTWNDWLGSEDEDLVSHAIWLIGQKGVLEQRSDEVAKLILPYLDGSAKWKKHFCTLIRFGEVHHGRSLFDLFLKGLNEDWYDSVDEHWWYHLHDFPDQAPHYAIELLVAYLKRQFSLTPEGDPFEESKPKEGLPQDFCLKLARKLPEAFSGEVFPMLAEEIERRPVSDKSHLEDRDCIWSYLSHSGYDHDFKASLLHALLEALKLLASRDPERFRELTAPFYEKNSLTLGYLLLETWRSRAEEFSREMVSYMCAKPSRLDIGYSVWGGGEGTGQAAISRQAIKAAAPLCSKEDYELLEAAIIDFRDPYEQRKPRFNGWTQLLLLKALPFSRMSRKATVRREELERKFPEIDDAIPRSIRSRGGFVGSPISPQAVEKMKDSHWISAMRRYSSDETEWRRGKSRGGAHELSSVLEKEAQADKPRFAALLGKMPIDINPAYFDAIIRGLVSTKVESQNDSDLRPGMVEPLEMTELAAAIRRVHSLPGKPCGRWLTSSIGKCAKRTLPSDIIEILTDYALNDPDPEKEMWQEAASGGQPYYGGNPLDAGINSVRGSAAWSISSILFAHPEIWPEVRHSLERLAEDASIAVKSCVVRCLLAGLNADRGEAVRLFLKLIENSSDVLRTGEIDSFLYYALSTHYRQLRGVLIEMLSLSKEARETASTQIAVASYSESQAEEDLREVLAGDEVCREAAAKVFAHNLGNPSVREMCQKYLLNLFSDPEQKVREAAAGCFRELGGDRLVEEQDLIRGYIQSPAFEHTADDFAYILKESSVRMARR